jgi:glycosyltransferase involved in cell wall biosynthesis
MPHGPHDHYQWTDTGNVRRAAPETSCNLLFFGLIRPYKGLDNLIRAFEGIPEEEISRFWLTIVGETWEGWTLPARLIEQSRYRHRITFVNRYVSDDEVDGFFRGADAVVLPYRRSCISGPLHVAMGYGLPAVVTRVGGLIETVDGYDGALLIPPEDEAALRDALLQVTTLRGRRFHHPRTWDDTASTYTEFFRRLRQAPPPSADAVEIQI